MAIWRRLWKHQKSGWDQQFAPTTSKNAGFTLIELLVSIILASLVVTPLLGFMINILQSDQREQAKYATEQDLRAAADYIAKDLEEAVYIYDRAGLASITGNYATNTCTGGCETSADSNLPADSNIVPVLVFWRRVFVPGIEIGEPDDAFAYSLVAYYLINDDDPTWSGASRIGRFEIAGGVTDPFNASTLYKNPDPGYNPFDLDEIGTLQENMNDWYKADEPYDRDPIVLVDYIYSSSDDPPPFESCPEADGWTQVPDYDDPGVDPKFQTYGFYACVKSNSLNSNEPGANEIARVFLRGNVLARLNDRDNIPSYNDDTSKVSFRNASFFPQTRIEVKGNGGL